MKRFLILLLTANLMGASVCFAQEDASVSNECDMRSSLYFESLKAKNYKDAYENWLYCFENCPNLHPDMYLHGVEILEAIIPTLATEDQKNQMKDFLKKVYAKRLELYPNEKIGYTLGKKVNSYNKFKLGTPEEIVAIVREAIAKDAKNIDAAVLNIYFNNAAILLNDKVYAISDVFDVYDQVTELLADNQAYLQLEYNKLTADRDTTQEMSSMDQRYANMYQALLKNNEIVTNNVERMIEPFATCDKLNELYTAQFDQNKTSEAWLKRAVQLLQHKNCFDGPLYVQVAEAYYQVSPTPRAARAIALLSFRNNDLKKAAEYFKKAADESDNESDKAKNLLNLAQVYVKQGAKSAARTAAQGALAIDPGTGNAWMLIGHLYSSSANECGMNEFEKRAVHFAAMDMYRKAMAVDPSVKAEASKAIASAQAYAPDKQMIFQYGMLGKKLTIGCWINYTVTLPNL